ncbi:synaptotagmin-16 [Pholidichthys leucotaenia]
MSPAPMDSAGCLFVWSDQCVIVCPLSLSLLPPVTPEAIGFLSAVGVFIVALAVLFLFINKKLCFSRIGGLPCLEPHGHRRKGRPGAHQGLVNSDEDDDATSSADSEDEVLRQFEISVSRSQSFRAPRTNLNEQQSQHTHLALGRRHKFTRLSDQEEGSTEPSDCEEMAAQKQQGFKDPLTAALEERERAAAGSVDRPGVVQQSAVREHPASSKNQQAEKGGEDKVMENDENEATDSSPTWTPECLFVCVCLCVCSSDISQTVGQTDLRFYTCFAEVTRQEQPPQDEVSSQPACASPRTPISKCGDLVLSLEYRPDSEKVLVSVISARDIPDKARTSLNSWQVHMVLLPSKKQRHKTSVQKGSMPHFNETFRFSHLEQSDLQTSAIRFRLYALGNRMSRERMIGEKVLHLREFNLEKPTMETTLVLEPRSNLKSLESQLSLSTVSQSDSASSTQSLTHGGAPELLLGLSYNATTGRMSVEIIKGSCFRNLAITRAPDTYGRLSLLNSVGQEICRCKTSVRRSQPNPVYKETFIFQVALFQLSDVTLLISIYNRRRMNRKEMVGWIALGQNSSGEEEQRHWQEMRDSRGQQVSRWHLLLEA